MDRAQGVGVFIQWLKMVTLSDVSDVLSIGGTFAALWVALQVRRLKRIHLRRVRLPSLVVEIQRLSSEISVALEDFKGNSSELDALIHKLRGVVISTRGKLNWGERSRMDSLVGALKLDGPLTEVRARSIYLNSLEVLEKLRDLNEDLAWR